jgi:Domain of unknown function (DUF4160)
MPIIAIFNGIIIQMFSEDQGPPHVHAIYSGAKALIRISDGEIMGETQACRADGELASCANGRPLLQDRRPQ